MAAFNLVHGVLDVLEESIDIGDAAAAALIEQVQGIHQLIHEMGEGLAELRTGCHGCVL